MKNFADHVVLLTATIAAITVGVTMLAGASAAASWIVVTGIKAIA